MGGGVQTDVTHVFSLSDFAPPLNYFTSHHSARHILSDAISKHQFGLATDVNEFLQYRFGGEI